MHETKENGERERKYMCQGCVKRRRKVNNEDIKKPPCYCKEVGSGCCGDMLEMYKWRDKKGLRRPCEEFWSKKSPKDFKQEHM